MKHIENFGNPSLKHIIINFESKTGMDQIRCPFCKNELEQSVFASSENFNAVYNIAPVLPGHSMIIPKSHIVHLSELSDNLYLEMMQFARHITRGLCLAFNTSEYNWSLQDGASAGQTVMHLHLHILVRKHGDMENPGDWYKSLDDTTELDSLNRPRLTNEEIQQAVAFLKPHFQ